MARLGISKKLGQPEGQGQVWSCSLSIQGGVWLPVEQWRGGRIMGGRGCRLSGSLLWHAAAGWLVPRRGRPPQEASGVHALSIRKACLGTGGAEQRMKGSVCVCPGHRAGTTAQARP